MQFGWIADAPDFRDYSPSHEKVLSILGSSPSKIGKKIDLRQYCSPVFDQGELGSCTANACAGMVGFYLNRLNGSSLPVSRLFIYKTTRNLMLETGDNGATIRSTMGSLALFGAPPEKYWEYVVKEFDVEPPAFCYSFASNYQALVYFKHDSVNSTLNSVKKIAQYVL